MRLVGRRQAENNLCNSKKNALRQTVKIFMHVRRIACQCVCASVCVGAVTWHWHVGALWPNITHSAAFALTVNGPTLQRFEYFADKLEVY